ncbi:Cbp1p SCDLUD_004052 [Saccharomycodes ludwigii]|uniref:Cbp1p n=1 Tax=Saccharomycodes ludwigii TaxID=36035 RepID=UPI001E82EBC8|nr:hypothetical protein SCDLUD_004052 [Saccharomycodes ludwigii]KAH3899764.1 hypothetical protein SCDLUD_004052 [Saccharomycodes ludwigii]
MLRLKNAFLTRYKINKFSSFHPFVLFPIISNQYFYTTVSSSSDINLTSLIEQKTQHFLNLFQSIKNSDYTIIKTNILPELVKTFPDDTATTNNQLISQIQQNIEHSVKFNEFIKLQVLYNIHDISLINKFFNTIFNYKELFKKSNSSDGTTQRKILQWLVDDTILKFNDYLFAFKVVKIAFKIDSDLIDPVYLTQKLIPQFLSLKLPSYQVAIINFIINYSKKYPQLSLLNDDACHRIFSILFTLKSGSNVNPVYIKRVANHILPVFKDKSTTKYLNYIYTLIKIDCGTKNINGVIQNWSKIENFYSDKNLNKHDPVVISKVLKILINNRLKDPTGVIDEHIHRIIRKLPTNYSISSLLILKQLLKFASQSNNLDLAAPIIDGLKQTTDNTLIKKFYSSLLMLHISFNDAAAVDELLKKIVNTRGRLSPSDLGVLVHHLLYSTDNNMRSENEITNTVSTKNINSKVVKIKEAIYMFEKITKNLELYEKHEYFPTVFPLLIKACLNVIYEQQKHVSLDDNGDRIWAFNTVNQLLDLCAKWQNLNGLINENFYSKISTIYFDYIIKTKGKSIRYNATKHTLNDKNDSFLQLLRWNYVLSQSKLNPKKEIILNEYALEDTITKNPFGTDHSLLENVLLINNKNRVPILRLIQNAAIEHESRTLERWTIRELTNFALLPEEI